MGENVLVQLFDGDNPATGKNPLISIWESDGTNVVSSEAMVERNDGWYFYDFSTFDKSKDYYFQAFEATLTGQDRYASGTSDNTGDIKKTRARLFNDSTLTENAPGSYTNVVEDDDASTLTTENIDTVGAVTTKQKV